MSDFFLPPGGKFLLPYGAYVCATREKRYTLLGDPHLRDNVFVRKTVDVRRLVVLLLFALFPCCDEGGMFMTKVVYLFVGGTLRRWC